MKFKLLIIFFALVFINACRFPSDEVENAEINSDSSIVNAAIKAKFFTEDSLPIKKIELTISGKDAKHIFDIDGKTNFNIENGGVDFFVAPAANPTNEKPITFTIQANLEGYLPLKQEVVVYNTNQKIIVKCIFKKDKVSNTEQKKEVFLNEKKILKKGTNQTVNSNILSTKANNKKPSIIERKKEKISIDTLPVISNSNTVLPKVEVKKPALTAELKKDSIIAKKEKISIDTLPVITNSNIVLPKVDVKKPALTAELKKDSIIAKKEKISIDTLPVISNSNTVLPKVEVKKPAFTSELKKDSIIAKKEKISIDTLPVITNSNIVLPKVDVKKPALTAELKKDSIIVKKEKIKMDTIALITGSDSILSKTENQKTNLITAQKKDTIPFNKKNFGISLGFGTIGFNINLHHQISKKFGLRIGYAEAYYAPQYFTVFSGNSTNVIADFQIKMINFQLDYFPFKNKIFRVTTGISKNFNTYFINVTPLTSQTFGFIVYPPESIGSMKVEAIVSDFNPYLGIGFGKTIPNTKLGMGLDLGLFYHGSPKFKLITTGSFGPSNNEKNVSLMNNAFNDWVFFPMANINITYRITN